MHLYTRWRDLEGKPPWKGNRIGICPNFREKCFTLWCCCGLMDPSPIPEWRSSHTLWSSNWDFKNSLISAMAIQPILYTVQQLAIFSIVIDHDWSLWMVGMVGIETPTTALLRSMHLLQSASNEKRSFRYVLLSLRKAVPNKPEYPE